LECNFGRIDELCGLERARLALDRLELGLLDAGDPMALEPPCLDEHLALERSHRLVVRLHGSVERLAELADVRAHGCEALVQLAPERAHLAGALCDRLLLPAVVDGAQKPDKVRRGRGNDVVRNGELDQRSVLLERGAQERLVREEHDDELGSRGQLPPVRLLAEPLDVLPHVPCVVDEPRLPFVVRRVLSYRVEVRDERHLRVDDDLLLAREPDDDIGAQHVSVRVRGRALLVEVAMLDHPRHLDDPLQLDLTPPAAYMRRAKGGDEISRLGA